MHSRRIKLLFALAFLASLPLVVRAATIPANYTRISNQLKATVVAVRPAADVSEAPSPLPPTEKPISPSTGAELRIGQVISIQVPPGAVVGEGAKIKAEVLPAGQQQELKQMAAQRDLTAVSTIVEITLTGQQVGPINIALSFDRSAVPAGTEIAVYFRNERTGRWVYLGGTVDADKGTVSVAVEHLSKFAVFACKPLPVLTDIAGHQHQKRITALASMDVLAGYPDGTFRPDTTVTRAEAAAMLARALWLKESLVDAERFADNAEFGWAKGMIGSLVAKGLVSGYPDGTFAGNKTVSRAEAAALVARVIEKALIQPPKEIEALQFTDNKDIPQWATSSARLAVAYRLMAADEAGRFRPTDAVSRAEMAGMLYRLIAE